eukprot:3305622-Alexandrium_andersonii.AAC.1
MAQSASTLQAASATCPPQNNLTLQLSDIARLRDHRGSQPPQVKESGIGADIETMANLPPSAGAPIGSAPLPGSGDARRGASRARSAHT